MLLTACMLKMVVWEMIIGQYRVWRSSWALALSAGSFPEGSWEDSDTGVSRFSLINSPKSWNRPKKDSYRLRIISAGWNTVGVRWTYRDTVVCHSAPTALADGGRVLQGGAVAVEHMQEDLAPVAAEHVADDLWARLPRLLKQHRSTCGHPRGEAAKQQLVCRSIQGKEAGQRTVDTVHRLIYLSYRLGESLSNMTRADCLRLWGRCDRLLYSNAVLRWKKTQTQIIQSSQCCHR